jgi:hypothetical protein
MKKKNKKKKFTYNAFLTVAGVILALACVVEIYIHKEPPLGLPPPVEIVVVFQFSTPASAAEDILRPYGYFSLIRHDLKGQYVVKLKKGMTPSQAIQELQKNSQVRIVRNLNS